MYVICMGYKVKTEISGQAIARKSRSRTPGYAPGNAARALRGPMAAVTAATQVGEGRGEEVMMGFN